VTDSLVFHRLLSPSFSFCLCNIGSIAFLLRLQFFVQRSSFSFCSTSTVEPSSLPLSRVCFVFVPASFCLSFERFSFLAWTCLTGLDPVKATIVRATSELGKTDAFLRSFTTSDRQERSIRPSRAVKVNQ